MNQIKSYKYRIYPNVKQEVLLNKTFGCVRYYWNDLVETFNSYDENNKILNYKTSKEIRDIHSWMKDVSASALQQKYRDFEQTKNQYFSKNRKLKIQKPSFKIKSHSQSFRLPNPKFRIYGNKIQIEKIGKVKILIDRNISDKAKLLSATISKNASNEYFVSICFKLNVEFKTKTTTINVGIDLGISHIATLSNGIQFNNARFLIKNQDKLKLMQRHLSRKVKNSNRWNKQRIKLAKIHQLILNQKNWYLHNISTWIVNNFDEIGMEDLNISGMIKNRNLAKHISDASMGKLKQFITYKQKEFNKEVILLNRFEASTKECNVCGFKKEMKLSDRIFNCDNCKLSLDRDYQASIVIRNKTVGVNAVHQTWSDNKTKIHEVVSWQLL